MNCAPCQQKPHSRPQPPHTQPPHPQPPSEEKKCYAEAEIEAKDKCGSKFRFRLVSDPNSEVLTCRIQEIETKLLNWIQRAAPLTELDMKSLGVFCFNSALTGFANADVTGIFVGDEAAGEFLRLFNIFKSKFNYITPSVTSRLIIPDLIDINLVFKATKISGPVSVANPEVGRFVFSGQFHVIDFGNELCVDWSNVYVKYPLV